MDYGMRGREKTVPLQSQIFKIIQRISHKTPQKSIVAPIDTIQYKCLQKIY